MRVIDLFRTEKKTFEDSDVRHVINGFTSVDSFNRLSFVSDSQINLRVCSVVAQEVYKHPELYKCLSPIMELASELVFYFSTSKDGFMFDKVVESVRSRLAVNDSIKIKGGQEQNELE